jgi:hypothetical protein
LKTHRKRRCRGGGDAIGRRKCIASELNMHGRGEICMGENMHSKCVDICTADQLQAILKPPVIYSHTKGAKKLSTSPIVMMQKLIVMRRIEIIVWTSF